VLDKDGYRLNVGIVIANGRGDVLWAHRTRQGGWQFPQGGIQQGETPEQAMYRELDEEVGLAAKHVDLLGVTRNWLRYRLPEQMIRHGQEGRKCIGQKQKWFLLHLKSEDSIINVDRTSHPEFCEWEWVSYWYPVNQIIEFKRWVYQRMLRELSSVHSQKVVQLARH